jgi:hypothetical protein
VEAVDVNGDLVGRLHDVRRPEPDGHLARCSCGVRPPRRRRDPLGRCARAVLDGGGDEAPHALQHGAPSRRRADPRIPNPRGLRSFRRRAARRRWEELHLTRRGQHARGTVRRRRWVGGRDGPTRQRASLVRRSGAGDEGWGAPNSGGAER